MKQHIAFDLEFKKNPYPGKFIVVEGIDGSGKTTQVEKLVEQLVTEGIDAVQTKEPTDGPIGKLIREVLSQKVLVPPTSIQYLIAADRAVHQEEIISLLQQGKVLVSDRYFWSAIAYGIADCEDVDLKDRQAFLVAQSILSMYNQFLLPDMTIYLETSVDTALKRLAQMDKEKELYEKKSKLMKIDEGYRWLMREFSDCFAVVDGEKPLDEVTAAALAEIKKAL